MKSMISTISNDRCFEFRGLEEDFNRIKDNAEFNSRVGNGSIFLLMDKSIVYMYDETNKKWVLLQ